jgi:hypothetical protein
MFFLILLGLWSIAWLMKWLKYAFFSQLLDCALGHNESALFRRAQLKALVSIHSKEVMLSYHSASWEVSMLNQGYITLVSFTMTGWQGWRAYSWWDYNHKWSLGSDWKGVYHIHTYIWRSKCTWYKAKCCYTWYYVQWLLPWSKFDAISSNEL